MDMGVYSVKESDAPEIDIYSQSLRYTIEKVDGEWVKVWIIEPIPNNIQLAMLDDRVDSYIQAMCDHQDSIARDRMYDNRMTCALRASYDGPYNNEGMAFAIWMDKFNYIGYRLIDRMKSGEMEWVCKSEFLDMLPKFNWTLYESMEIDITKI
jgi:hypothetical protein